MSPARYNAFIAWTRSPAASDIGEELEFFSSTDETLIGALVKDKSDRDFGFVTMGRDLSGALQASAAHHRVSLSDLRLQRLSLFLVSVISPPS